MDLKVDEDKSVLLTPLSLPLQSSTSGPSPSSPKGQSNPGADRFLREDEPNLIMKMFGLNEVPYAEMWGWTNAIPLKFPTLKTNLELKTLNSLPHYQDLVDGYATKLEDLAKYAPCAEYSPINVPVVVQVVAKKKVDVIIMQRKIPQLLLIGNLLVADETGVCLCTLFNEAVSIVHDRLKIGDTLVIKGGNYKPIEKDKLTFLHRFYEDLLNVEIKIDKYSVRQNQIVTIPIPALQKFHDYLFASPRERIWTPSDLQDKDGNVIPPENSLTTPLKNLNHLDDRKEHYLDIIGVVSYVGRVERTVVKTTTVECLVDVTNGTDGDKETIKGTSAVQTVTQFVAYRWIQLVDCHKKPIYVKMYLKKELVQPFIENKDAGRKNKDKEQKQSKVVPGIIILLTNCFIKKSKAFENFVSDSVYTSVFINYEVKNYFKLLPERCWKDQKIHELIKPDKYSQLLTSKDVQWTAGGTYQPQLKSEEEFIKEYYETIDKKIEFTFPIELPRRQLFPITFKGKIIRVLKLDKDKLKLHMLNENGFKIYFCFEGDRKDGYEVKEEIETSWPYFRNHCLCNGTDGVNCQQLKWFSFKRHLPPLKGLAKGDTMKEIFNKVSDQREGLCSPLLMPSKIRAMPQSALPTLASCKEVEKMPYYLVKLKDEDHKCYYEAFLSNSHFQRIAQKLLDAKGKSIIALVDCHKLYSGPYNKYDGCEVILRDFAIDI